MMSKKEKKVWNIYITEYTNMTIYQWKWKLTNRWNNQQIQDGRFRRITQVLTAKNKKKKTSHCNRLHTGVSRLPIFAWAGNWLIEIRYSIATYPCVGGCGGGVVAMSTASTQNIQSRMRIGRLYTGAIYSTVKFRSIDLKISEQSENCAQHYPSLRSTIRNLRTQTAIYTKMSK